MKKYEKIKYLHSVYVMFYISIGHLSVFFEYRFQGILYIFRHCDVATDVKVTATFTNLLVNFRPILFDEMLYVCLEIQCNIPYV